MADAAPERSYPPIPPWRVQLTGTENDLRDLANNHSLGRIRVIQFQEKYFLEADALNSLSDCNRVSEKAREILQLIGGLAKVRRFSAFDVKAASIWWTDGNGNWVDPMLVTEQHWIVPGTKYLEGANISERIVTLAETDLIVRTNLMDFFGEWDFCRLRRIAASILMEFGGENKGVDEFARLGWATKPECKRFLKSVNLGSEYYRGAHSPFEPYQNKNPMPLVAAVEFMRKLLAQWIKSKIAMAK